MKRVLVVAVLCATAVVSISLNTQAQGKKKGKEPELALSKRGKLLLEDDFSEKEVVWMFHPDQCDWQIVNKTLATKSTGVGAKVGVSRSFVATENLIVELRMFLPIKSRCLIGMPYLAGRCVYAHIIPSARTFEIHAYVTKTADEVVAVGPLFYQKPRWVQAVYETMSGKFALTVDGKTIQWEQVPYESGKPSKLELSIWQNEKEVAAFDDVKVYEALPKDEGEDKDEKGKKGK